MDWLYLTTELLITLVGIFIGTLLALIVERRGAERRKHKRAEIILRSLAIALSENDETLLAVRDAYLETPWGKSFYLDTSAWDTALASGDLPDIIGFGLADVIATQYALLVRIRYYVDLLTQLWFAPPDIEGYTDIREGFRQAIVDSMTAAIDHYPAVMEQIDAVQAARAYAEEP